MKQRNPIHIREHRTANDKSSLLIINNKDSVNPYSTGNPAGTLKRLPSSDL